MTTLLTLKTVIHKTFDIDPSTLDAGVPLADYGLDSLSLAELLFVVEDEFHIDFSEMPKDVNTLADLAKLIDQLQVKQAA